jgi:hypothetical protein
VSNPNETWANAPAPRSPDSDQVAGRGLFLVEQLSDRWGTSDADCTVWFELDHRSPARPTPNDDIRSDGDRRKVSVSVAGADERRRPAHRRGGHNDAWWWS